MQRRQGRSQEFFMGRVMGSKLAQKGAWWRAWLCHAMLFPLSWEGSTPNLPPFGYASERRYNNLSAVYTLNAVTEKNLQNGTERIVTSRENDN
jgi:hypothetical protein